MAPLRPPVGSPLLPKSALEPDHLVCAPMQNVKIDVRWSDSTGGTILWLAIGCFLATAIAFSWNPTPFAQALAAIYIASALSHASVAYGLSTAVILFFICN